MVLKNEILIYNLSNERIPPKRFFQELINKALAVLGERNKVSLSLIFIDSQKSRQLNKFWRNKNKAASVLSFSLQDPLPIKSKREEKILGDVFLCHKQIKSQAQRLNVPLDVFYKKLIVHSLLHLYGYDHSKAKDKQKMEGLEEEILKSCQ